jgi:hypothetical protein
MYIRKSNRVHNGKTYTNHVLVESVMTPKGPRQKTICSLGDLGPRPREDWLKLARKMEDALSLVSVICSMRMRANSAIALRACGHGDPVVSSPTPHRYHRRRDKAAPD